MSSLFVTVDKQRTRSSPVTARRPSLSRRRASENVCSVTSEGHPGAQLQRALKAGNLIAAEQAAFEVAFVPLAEARVVVEVYAEKGDRKFERVALKYLRRCMAEAHPSLTDVAQVAALLASADRLRFELG